MIFYCEMMDGPMDGQRIELDADLPPPHWTFKNGDVIVSTYVFLKKIEAENAHPVVKYTFLAKPLNRGGGGVVSNPAAPQ